jgi:membrane protein DedA with SNARE-associated domain
MTDWVPPDIQGYPSLFLLCAGSGIVVPLPEDLPLMYAGIRLHDGLVTWPATLLVASLGVLTRDGFVFLLGRIFGAWMLERDWIRRVLGRTRVARAERLIDSHGTGAVLIGRFLVGFRAPVFFAAGAAGMDPRRFVLWDSAGLLVAVPLAVTIGFQFGRPAVDAVMAIAAHSGWVLSGGVLLLAARWVWMRRAALLGSTSRWWEDE